MYQQLQWQLLLFYIPRPHPKRGNVLRSSNFLTSNRCMYIVTELSHDPHVCRYMHTRSHPVVCVLGWQAKYCPQAVFCLTQIKAAGISDTLKSPDWAQISILVGLLLSKMLHQPNQEIYHYYYITLSFSCAHMKGLAMRLLQWIRYTNITHTQTLFAMLLFPHFLFPFLYVFGYLVLPFFSLLFLNCCFVSFLQLQLVRVCNKKETQANHNKSTYSAHI